MAIVSSGSVSSWQQLSSAIETFTTSTLGTYTLVYNNGASFDGSGTSIALNHTLSGMNFMWDGSSMLGMNTQGPQADEQCLIGCMATGTVSGAVRITDQVGRPNTTVPSATLAGLQLAYLCSNNSMFYGDTVRYTFFGDTPAAGGEDYFHMAIEIFPGMFTHWWTGQVVSDLTEMAPDNFGSFMGCSGPYRQSNIVDYRKNPLSGEGHPAVGRDPREFFYFPKGTNAGQIDLDTSLITNWSLVGVANTNWAIRTIGLGAGYNHGAWVCGKDPVSGRIITGTPVLNLNQNAILNSQYFPGVSAKIIPVGLVPGVRHVCMESLLPGDSFDIGASSFSAFPTGRRSGAPATETIPTTYTGSSSGFPSGAADGYSRYRTNPDISTGYEGFAYVNN